ncbi:nuclear transport factor 2 family protein [Chitinophaga alhagiae]|uniref:nuclear transport factor 2 family protein n=1 Tax=Chitinophaga alhagiae TaxID=2203219 RepID=UPI000E5B7466|nr:nuclear transport factor 2 family protein [Chitinophaga alhagiae]
MKQLFALLMVTSLFNVAAAQSKDEAAIAKAVETLRKAMVDADRSDLEKLTAPSLTYGHSNGRIEDRAEFIGNLMSGQSDFVTMDLTAQTIAITGPTAIVRHTLTAQTNDGGKPGNVKLYVMLVWGKNGGQWKLIGRQAVKVPVP